MEDTIIKYAVKDPNGKYQDVYGDVRTFSSGMVCSGDDVVYELELVEIGEGEDYDFVGFRYSEQFGGDGDVDLIWSLFNAFDMCFTYGVEEEVERGMGEIVYMQLVGERELGRARDL